MRKFLLLFLLIGLFTIPLKAGNFGGGSGGSGGSGDMEKATYDTNDNSIVDKAEGLTENTVTETTIVDGTITETDLSFTPIKSGDNVSLLTNDAGYLTGSSSINDLGDVDTTGWASGKVLKFDASGNLIVEDDLTGGGGTSPFSYYSATDVIHTDTSIATDTADFVVGSPQLDDDGDTAHDYRMFFDKSKAAFRVGRATDTQWDDANRGLYSFACGYNTTANGNYSHAEGGSTTASGEYSHAEGYETTASGNYGSHAEGYYSNAYLYSQHAQASGRFANTGDAQFSRVVLIADTTDATQETMYIDNNSSYKVILPASTTWGFRANIVARSDSGVSSYWEIKGMIKRDAANNTSLVGTITKTLIAQDSGASSWDVTAEADDTNEALAIKITGAASTNIRWVASIELVECGY